MTVSEEKAQALYQRLKREAEAAGYHLNPDVEFTMGLVTSLLINEERYGYWACPCRLASGDKAQDLDIICPCDYRDADLNEWGACYCALYVSADIAAGKRQAHSIPERRPSGGAGVQRGQESASQMPKSAIPIWRCRVCGYLCAREQPPEVCPICKAKRERFERFLL
jgi:ferredoxin-thioredoxin reductase catalytic chain